MHTKEEKLAQFGRLLDIMDKIREECPWNKEQTIDSLRTMTIEEVYELSDAIIKKSDTDLKKELGDVLLHIVFYSRIAQEQEKYDIYDVIDSICEKMIYRHPHVFAKDKVANASDVSTNWEMLKAKEKGGNKRILSGIPDAMPTIIKAYAMQDKARGVGFDWKDKCDVWAKVKEELGEFQAELEQMSVDASAHKRAEEELGDYLFSIINAARLYGLNPDTALNMTCDKFRKRFTYLEEQTLRQGRDLHDMTLEEMDKYWNEAKNM